MSLSSPSSTLPADPTRITFTVGQNDAAAPRGWTLT